MRLGAIVSVLHQVSFHSCVCSDEKGDYLCNRHVLDLLSVTIQKSQNHYSFCGFLFCVHCILVIQSTQKEQIHVHKVVAKPVEEEDLVAHKIPLTRYCSKIFNIDDE